MCCILVSNLHIAHVDELSGDRAFILGALGRRRRARFQRSPQSRLAASGTRRFTGGFQGDHQLRHGETVVVFLGGH